MRALIFIAASLISVGLVVFVGFTALLACFGLAFLTLWLSTGAPGVKEDKLPLQHGARAAHHPHAS
ncbi:MAG: hypothetical protein ABW220_04820 [Burkholderiaceae bacterium]